MSLSFKNDLALLLSNSLCYFQLSWLYSDQIHNTATNRLTNTPYTI